MSNLKTHYPIIVSVSRRTDIPAFHMDKFFKELEQGYTITTNPYNNVQSKVNYQDTRLIVFWSKNPENLLHYLSTLKRLNINIYIQYTINDYEFENLEPNIPTLEHRINVFKELVNQLGFGNVIWRFDPILLSSSTTIQDVLNRVEYIGNRLWNYTEKMVFSFVDIENYKSVKKRVNDIRELTEEEKLTFVKGLSHLNRKWKYQLATCGEDIDIKRYGIFPNKCIDDELIIKLFSHDEKLMDYLGYQPSLGAVNLPTMKDKNQRKECGCIVSKDIGEYNTCQHNCVYCYANHSKNNDKIDGFFNEYRWLSNFWYHPEIDYTIDDPLHGRIKLKSKCSEIVYQALKCSDLNELSMVSKASNPKESKRLGYKVKLRDDWDNVKLCIMEQIVRQKFQIPELKQKLLDTGDKELIEQNYWNDTYYGVCNGIGENHLGKILMKIRDELKTK